MSVHDTAPVADWVTIPDLYRDPFPIYERLRAEGGVHWVPSVGRYLITSYEAVHETEFDQEIYSANEEGSLQIRAMGHSMLRRDDPEHYPERKAWQPVLRPGVVKRTWTKIFEQNAERYLNEMLEKGTEGDLVWDFAAPYAAENLREVIGFHNATQEDLQRWSQTMIDATGNYADDPKVWELGRQSFEEVDIALDEMLRWHAKNPDHSLLSSLLRIPDYQMPLEKIRANVKMTIGGGLNEPRDAIGVAAWAMLTHPEQLQAVESDPSLWQTVFDESIRWVAPIGMYSRQVTRDTELAGVRLPAGAKLGICILSANRDESVWDRPEQFDIGREVFPHLAFSKGVHVCLGAWVARAEVATVGLPAMFRKLRGLRLREDAQPEIGGWVFRGMLKLPAAWDVSQPGDFGSINEGSAVSQDAPSVAIVGSGPAGCFAAQALRKAYPQAEIDVIDRLPTPYGLVRYGVATDHQGTKAVSRQFDRLFTHDGVRFHGGVSLGESFSLEALRERADVVVLATGVSKDAELPIPGATLPGVYGAGHIARVLNSHPDETHAPPSLGRQVVIVGHGNVALDTARLLASNHEHLDGSDVDEQTHARLVSNIREIHLVGRSLAAHAKFDPVMVRELARHPGVAHSVHGQLDGETPDGKDARVDAVRALTAKPTAAAGSEEPRVHMHWWFGLNPVRVLGGEHVQGLQLVDSRGEMVSLKADSIVTAVGFTEGAEASVQPGAHPDARVEPGLYVAGWLRRGPRGTIPDQRTDAQSLVQAVVADVASGALSIGREGTQELASESEVIDFDGWRRIDLRETLGAAPGRARAKLRSYEELFATARDQDIALPPLEESAQGVAATGLPITILFATESGNAELVAEDLYRSLESSGDVKILDLADADPGDLDEDRLHLVVCSTYGDGELPTSARPFYDALTTGSQMLASLRYGIFGLGDRSYTKTYSRGSELLDEALTGAGAERVGAYGRHDAGGPLDVSEAAHEWLEGLLAEVSLKAV